MARDITDQRQTMAELQKRDATIRAFFESASEGIVGVDRDGRIVLVNPRLESMFGYEREELMGQSVELVGPTNPAGPWATPGRLFRPTTRALHGTRHEPDGPTQGWDRVPRSRSA